MTITFEHPFNVQRNEAGKLEEPVASMLGVAFICYECEECSYLHKQLVFGFLLFNIIINW